MRRVGALGVVLLAMACAQSAPPAPTPEPRPSRETADTFVFPRMWRAARPSIHPQPVRVASLPMLAPARAAAGSTTPISNGLVAVSVLDGPDRAAARFAVPEDALAIVQPPRAAWHLRCHDHPIRTATGAAPLGAIPVRWEVLSRRAPGASGPPPALDVTLGWLDPNYCVLGVHQRASVQPVPLLAGLVLAARWCEESCAERVDLSISMPRVSSIVVDADGEGVDVAQGPFTRLRLPLRRDSTASAVARLVPGDVAAWMREHVSAVPDGPLQVGVEVAWTRAEAEPVALVWLAEDRVR